MCSFFLRFLPLLLCLLGLPQSNASPKLNPVLTGLARPVWMEQVPGTEQFILIQQYQAALVWDRAEQQLQELPFFDLSEEISTANEQGILCLVFAPDFAESKQFYIYFTNKDGNVQVERWQTSTNRSHLVANPQSRQKILEIEQPWGNHNGGWMDFGADGFLYLSVGDGGASNDPNNNAQNLNSFLGKILRIAVTDVDFTATAPYLIPADNPLLGEESARPEIVAWGARNAWRCSWDFTTNQLWIADVGQNVQEEINVLTFSQLLQGANLGWRIREGSIATPSINDAVDTITAASFIAPLYSYGRGSGDYEGFSVTGGYVYRGENIPSLQGYYLFADYQNPRIWAINTTTLQTDPLNVEALYLEETLAQASPQVQFISSFAEDENGELYLIDHSGTIYELTP